MRGEGATLAGMARLAGSAYSAALSGVSPEPSPASFSPLRHEPRAVLDARFGSFPPDGGFRSPSRFFGGGVDAQPAYLPPPAAASAPAPAAAADSAAAAEGEPSGQGPSAMQPFSHLHVRYRNGILAADSGVRRFAHSYAPGLQLSPAPPSPPGPPGPRRSDACASGATTASSPPRSDGGEVAAAAAAAAAAEGLSHAGRQLAAAARGALSTTHAREVARGGDRWAVRTRALTSSLHHTHTARTVHGKVLYIHCILHT
jgi:hypothetical protein